MTEFITKIEEVSICNQFEGWDGYRISTSLQDIEIGISNFASCCEVWGYMTSEDDFARFIGARLMDVRVVNKSLSVLSVDMYEGAAMFINIHTDRGMLQFAVYNQHNGYYGHDAFVRSLQIKHDEIL